MTKHEVIALIESLPDDMTWDDILYQPYVHVELEAGFADLDAGRTVSSDEVGMMIQRWLHHGPGTRPKNA